MTRVRRPRAAALLASAFVAVVLGPRAASADEPAAPSAGASLALAVTPGEGGAPWTLRISNGGELPVRLAADARLLSFEVTPPAGAAGAKASQPVTCVLPEDGRPASDEGQELVVPAKRSWSMPVDPLLYCFDARARAALVPGAIVKARFGWTSRGVAKGKAPAKEQAPFVASPVGASVGKLAPAKALESSPFTLTEAQRVSAAPLLPATPGKPAQPAPTAEPEERPSGLALVAAATLDVSRGVDLPVTVTLVNEGDRPAVLVFRPEMIRFRVASPSGTVSCGSTLERASPIRELFATLPPRGRASQTVLLSASCPDGTFDAPGLYRATAILDTSRASGRPIGVKSFDGIVTAKEPTLVRVRAVRRPVPTKRPVLD